MNSCKWKNNPVLAEGALRELLREGKTYDEIAARAGVSRGTVITAIRERHLSTGPKKLKGMRICEPGRRRRG
ncbi:MAG TPA: hypothetical protein O0X70_04500 [Methanocorpusculum sp.]|nr:hypothetical protein [Methanocorpusculum sp.]